MPLISLQEMIPGVRIALWKPAETSEELLSILGNTHLYESIMTSCKTEKRKIEKLTTRILINLLQKGETEIKYMIMEGLISFLHLNIFLFLILNVVLPLQYLLDR